MPLTPSLRHCSNKYKLAREGEKDKEKDEDFEKVKVQFFFFFLCSQVELKEMSFQLLLENWQGSSIPDGGGKIIPPPRNSNKHTISSNKLFLVLMIKLEMLLKHLSIWSLLTVFRKLNEILCSITEKSLQICYEFLKIMSDILIKC